MAVVQDLGHGIHIRQATKADVEGLVEVFFRSFNAPYWQHLFPDTPEKRQWWRKSWDLSFNNPSDRSFVAEDTTSGNKIVAFSRWMVPQADGSLERPWPELKEGEWDMELAGAFFGGMDENHEETMHTRPHWFLELLAVHEDYQRRGIADALVRWGIEQADEQGLETYLDASEVGLPWYKKHHGFKEGKAVILPDRPSYGSYSYMSIIREPQGQKEA